MRKFLASVLVVFPLLCAVGTEASIAAPNYLQSMRAEDSAIGNGQAGTTYSYLVVPLVQPASPESAQQDAPRFVGTSEVHDGLLPNGLMPNPPTYG